MRPSNYFEGRFYFPANRSLKGECVLNSLIAKNHLLVFNTLNIIHTYLGGILYGF